MRGFHDRRLAAAQHGALGRVAANQDFQCYPAGDDDLVPGLNTDRLAGSQALAV